MNEIQIDKEIEDYLHSYKVDFPHEEEIDESIQAIMAAIPAYENKRAILFRKTKTLALYSWHEMVNFRSVFWILNGLFLLLGAVSIAAFESDPYIKLFVLAPLPFITGIFEILKSRDEGLMELELTLRYSTKQILTSRLFVVGLYNLIVNFGFSMVSLLFYPELDFMRLLITWTVPYVFITALAFLFALKVRGRFVSGVLLTIWFAVSFGVIQSEEAVNALLKLNVFPAVFLLLSGILMWISHVKTFKNIEIGRVGNEA